jgi:hypothetical protein
VKFVFEMVRWVVESGWERSGRAGPREEKIQRKRSSRMVSDYSNKERCKRESERESTPLTICWMCYWSQPQSTT